jgi:hypothetical protein
MVTCRICDDPASSVVNGWGCRHTAGAVNPTSTIQALALYIGDRIKTNIENLFD